MNSKLAPRKELDKQLKGRAGRKKEILWREQRLGKAGETGRDKKWGEQISPHPRPTARGRALRNGRQHRRRLPSRVTECVVLSARLAAADGDAAPVSPRKIIGPDRGGLDWVLPVSKKLNRKRIR